MSDIEPGGFDMSRLLEQAQQVQSQLHEAQAKLADELFEGVSGGGAVRVWLTGNFTFQDVKIAPDALDDLEMLQDLVLAALRDAVARVQEGSQDALGSFGGMLG